jgi:hypothetical protein
MTYGLAVLGLNLGYLLFSLILAFSLAKLLKKSTWFQKRSKALLTVILFLLIFLAPFYDLLIQKGIKTYYEVFNKTYAEIYDYPEKDSEGRVESLGMNRDYYETSSGYLSTNKKFNVFKNGENVNKFIEYYFFNNFEKDKRDIGYARVYLNKKELNYEKILGPNDFKARYQILEKTNNKWFYKEIETTFWDKKENKLLAKTLEISFPVKNNKNKFRYKYLHWHGANGGYGASIDDITYNNMFNKLF